MKNAMQALRAHAKKPASEAHGVKPAKGGMAKYNQGGVTNDMLLKMGAGMARVENQGPVGRKGKK